MLLALSFHYVGEEPIFPISSQEMWQQGVWLRQLMLGTEVLHPPLFNWLIATLSSIIGWPHVKEAARILTIMFTAGTGLMLAWLTFRLSRDRLFAALAAASYLTFQDILLYHGWLAYVDPTFAFFIFSSIALLWVASREQNRILFGLSLLAITCAFLSKALTAYVFYGSAIFVLLVRKDTRHFLLGPLHVGVLLATFAFPVFWYRLQGGGNGGQYMLGEILSKLTGAGSGGIHPLNYLTYRLSYLLETLSELFPVAWLAIYVLARKITSFRALPEFIRTGGWMALLCYLPYWLSPESGVRYLLPIYPLFALLAAGIIWQAGEAWIRHAWRYMLGMLALQLVLFLVAFPFYQNHYRGENYMRAAREIVRLTSEQKLYNDDTTSSGLIVMAYLNALRYPEAALQMPPKSWENGFMLTRSLGIPDTAVVKKFSLAADDLYLLCRGTSCSRVP